MINSFLFARARIILHYTQIFCFAFVSFFFDTSLSAYEVLSDSEKRNIYDRYGEEGLKQHAAGGGRGPGMNIQDIFNE